MMKVALKESFLELRKFTRLYANKYFLLVMIVIGAIVLLLPGMLRETPFMIGDESFYHIRIANSILENGGVDYDKLSFSGRDSFMEKGLSYSVAGVAFISGLSVEVSAKMLFLFLGLLSLMLIYFILERIELKGREFMLPIYVFSPAFIYLFSVVNKFAIPIFLTLLLIYFVLRKNYILSFIFLFFIPFFNLIYFIFLMLFSLLIFLYVKKQKLLLSVYLVFALIFLFSFQNTEINIISDFGKNIGLSIFGVFVLLFGLGSFWKGKRSSKFYFISLLLFLVSIKFSWAVFILAIPFSFLVGFNLQNLIKSKWESRLIKDLTVLLLICGLLFSGLSSVKSLSEEEPRNDLFNALSMLPKESVVLSHSLNGHWIAYAGMKNVLDDFRDFKGIEIREKDVNTLFSTRDFSIATRILKRYNVDYILITRNMRHGIVWNKDEEGLLFLLEYSEEFTKVQDGEVEIWRYLKE